MSKYKVIVIGVLGLNKHVYKANEIVTDENFPKGAAIELAKKGYLEPLDKKGEKKKVDDAKKALTIAEDAYTEAQEAIKELEKAKKEEKDEKKIAAFEEALIKAGKTRQESEVLLNKAKADFKKLQ